MKRCLTIFILLIVASNSWGFGFVGGGGGGGGANTASAVSNTPSGSIAAVTVQAAIDELDTEKVSTSTFNTYATSNLSTYKLASFGAYSSGTTLQTAINSVSASGGGVIEAVAGAVIHLHETLVPKNRVWVKLNGGTLKWDGGASGVMVENTDYTTTYGTKFFGLTDGYMDPGSNAINVFKFHSLRSSKIGNLKLISGNNSLTFLYLLANASTVDPADGVKNSVFNDFGPFLTDKATAGVSRVQYGVVLEGNDDGGGWNVITGNEFIGPFQFYVTTTGYRFVKRCDSNNFTGTHYVTLTTDDANGTGAIFNDSDTPAADSDVWGISFDYLGVGTWYADAENIGKRSVVLNHSGANTIRFLNNDRPAFWGSNLIVDNNSQGHDITEFQGTPNNLVIKHIKGDVEVTDEAYGAGWNGSLEVPTKNALYDKLEISPLTTATVTINPSDTAAVAPFILTRGTPDLATSGAYNLLFTNTNVTAASPHASATVRGYNMNPVYSGGGTLATMSGFFSTPRNTGVGTVTTLAGYNTDMRNTNASGTVTNLIGYSAASPILTGPVGTILGMKIANQGNAQSSNAYGIYVDSQSGSTNSYALYTNDGLVRFGGITTFTSSIVLGPDATACSSANRGAIRYVAGGAGVADKWEGCSKAGADTYAWRDIATPVP
jgi:hypothetical protein